MNLSEREKRLAMITLPVAIVGILLMGWKVMFSQSDQARISQATAERFEELFVKIKNVEAQKSQNRQLRKKLGIEKGEFVSENDVLKMVAEIEQVAGQSGVQIKNWDPNVNKRAKPLAQLDIKITMECQFTQLVSFFTNLRKSKYACQPMELRARLKDPQQPNLEVSMTLTTYLLNSAPEPVSPTLVKR
jgi:Tfp pilus assembly protein PilO